MISAALALFAAPEPIQERFDALFEASKLPGLSACVVLKDGSSVALARGHADEAQKVPMTVGHRFLAGSTGKTFFAALALQLEKEGTIALTDKLSKHLGSATWYSRLPNGGTVTLAQLMRHQSGIPEHLDDERVGPALAKDPKRVWKPEELVAFSLDKEPLFPAGDGWSYSDTNYVLLAMAIEKATGKSCYAMIGERFLRPLGLKDTEPSVRLSYERFANGHHTNGAIWENGWAAKDGVLKVNPQFEWAGGGFVTTPRDLATWVHSLGRVLDPQQLAKMRDAVPARTGRNHEYGHGLQVRPSELGKSYGHSGWYPGYITDVQHFPESGVTVCVMANTDLMSAFGTNYQTLCVELAKAATSPRSTSRSDRPR